jgi:hypothetical protein
MTDRYPGYDVLAKRWTASWNEQTRRVIDARLAIRREPSFFSAEEWQTLEAVCARVMPQPKDRPPIPLAAMIDEKTTANRTDGYRPAALPPLREAWRRGLHALDAEATAKHGQHFSRLSPADQDALLRAMEEGALQGPEWKGMPSKTFFSERMVHDIVAAYYAHPVAWNEIGFGGPASPRGYVRMNFNRRDSWEAAEAKPGRESEARRENERVG